MKKGVYMYLIAFFGGFLLQDEIGSPFGPPPSWKVCRSYYPIDRQTVRQTYSFI